MFGKKINKKVTKEKEAVEPSSTEISTSESTILSKPAGKREHLFGTLLLGILIVVVCFGLFGVGFGAFTLWQKQSMQNEAPSISGLANTPPKEVIAVTPPATEAVAAEVTKEETPETQESTKVAQALDIIVMNGGGAKGVATEVATLLRQKGFSKVTVGNTKADFTGTTIYSKKNLTKEAEALKMELVAQYPSIVVKEALASDPETQTASLTIIFGKE